MRLKWKSFWLTNADEISSVPLLSDNLYFFKIYLVSPKRFAYFSREFNSASFTTFIFQKLTDTLL